MTRCLRCLLLTVAASACRDGSPSTADLVIEHVAIVDVIEGAVRQDQTVFVERGRISAVRPTRRSTAPDGAFVVDGTGLFALPGLWDAHVHTAASRRAWDFPLLVAHGVTSVRNMHADGDALGEIRAIKRGLDAGDFVGPRYLANGPLVDGYPPVHRGSVVVRTPSAARAAVDSLADGGADFIKVYDNLTRESYEAILDQARARGIAVDGHMPFAVPAIEAARAGQRTVEHLTGITLGCSSDIDAIRSAYAAHIEGMLAMDPADELRGWMDIMRRVNDSHDAVRCGSVVAAYAEERVAVVPTLVYAARHADPRPLLDDSTARRLVPADAWDGWHRMADSGVGEEMASLFGSIHRRSLDHVRAMHTAGVPVLAGTDLGNEFIVPGRSLHDELSALVSAGLSPLDALRSATIVPARVFGLADSLGTATPGSVADLVLLADNPLVDIEHVRSVAGVVLRGTYHDLDALDALVAAAVGLNGAPPLPARDADSIDVDRDLAYAWLQDGPAGGYGLDVYARPGLEGAPVVISLHGGAGTKDSPPYVEASRRLAGEDLVVFNVTYPGGSPPSYLESDGEPLRVALETVLCATRFAAERAPLYGGDPNNVVVLGHSAGGYMGLVTSLLGGALRERWDLFASVRGGPSSEVRCASPEPAPAPVGFVGFNGAYFVFHFFGLPEQDAALWEVVNPGEYVALAPTLKTRFILGTEDATQPLAHLEMVAQFSEDRLRAGSDSEVVRVPSSHGYSFEPDVWGRILATILDLTRSPHAFGGRAPTRIEHGDRAKGGSASKNAASDARPRSPPT